MNRDELKGKWTQLMGQARERWGELTDDDVARVEGDREQLIGLIQERYGKARAEAEREVDQWLQKAA